nr:unnamed protein product [Callosobruchus analis]
MNDQILGLLDGDYTTYLSDDSVETEDDGERLNFTIEFSNSINPSGMPQHRLRLKSTTQHRRHQPTPAPPFKEEAAEVAVAQVAAATAAAVSQLQPPP